MRKFNVLFDQGIWNHAIVGFDDGSFELIKDFKHKSDGWIDESLDQTIKVIRSTKISGKDLDIVPYSSDNLGENPNRSMQEIRVVREESTTYDIRFFADFIVNKRRWVLLGEKPDVFL